MHCLSWAKEEAISYPADNRRVPAERLDWKLFLDKMISFSLLKALGVDGLINHLFTLTREQPLCMTNQKAAGSLRTDWRSQRGHSVQILRTAKQRIRFQQIIWQSVLTVSYRLHWNAQPLRHGENVSFTAYTARESYTAWNIKTSKHVRASRRPPGGQCLLVCLHGSCLTPFPSMRLTQKEHPSNLDHKKKGRFQKVLCTPVDLACGKLWVVWWDLSPNKNRKWNGSHKVRIALVNCHRT